ncbi:MAG: alpha-amylase family protein [Bryobacteraceae bacterium]|jgi:hypothetical protein
MMTGDNEVTRRTFLQTTAGASALAGQTGAPAPWYKRVCRWGQTNIAEKDPVQYDIPWWREYWKRTEVQGVIVNAGGIVAYYPSKFPLQHRAEFLNGRDLFGELAQAAHADGLAVLARMDSNRTAEDFFQAHPDWFARDASGAVIRAADKFVTCVNSPYYDEYLPGILTEIIERSHPEGVTDNSWSGLSRDTPCYCENCKRKFREKTGQEIPAGRNWNEAAYRQWIEWNYARRIEIWDLNNRVTKAAGGPDCLWIGMNSGSVTSQAQSFRPMREICARAEMILLDHQSRSDATGFQQNADAGKLVHGLLGWDKLAPESMAMYQAGRSSFRVAAKPAPEARMWMIEGFAGGIQPWWHHVGAYQEDRRAYHTAEPLMRWHQANQQYLIGRKPVASVGLVWSQRNTDYYGRDNAADLVDAPYSGFTQALLRARIPYVPVNAGHIDRDGPGLAVLVLPNVGALSDDQAASIRRFVERGGALIATGVSSLYNEWGDARPDFALASLFGAHAAAPEAGRSSRTQTLHTYLRLAPELRAKVWGPKAGDEPAPIGERHAVLRGFEETDILAYGGTPEAVRIDPGVVVPLTYIPPFPISPPETAWMRTPQTDIPGLVLNTAGKSRIAYLPADIDRRYVRDSLPDHADLLANIVRWAAGGQIPLAVKGAGLIDCHLYRQPGRVVLHVVNLISAGTWRSPIDELIPIGPLEITVKLPDDVKGRTVQHLVSGAKAPAAVKQGWATFELKSVLDHEVAVIG